MHLRKTVLAFMLLVLAAVSFAFTPRQSPAPNAQPEDRIRQLERDWIDADAQADTTSLSRIVADDFMGGSPDGNLLGKADIIPRGGGPGAFAGATPQETNVRIYGDTAVLMGFIKTADSRLVRVTLVCQKRSNSWQIIAAQLSHP